jgi:hypothetical protein
VLGASGRGQDQAPRASPTRLISAARETGPRFLGTGGGCRFFSAFPFHFNYLGQKGAPLLSMTLKRGAAAVMVAAAITLPTSTATASLASAAVACAHREPGHIAKHGGQAIDDAWHLRHGQLVTCREHGGDGRDRRDRERERRLEHHSPATAGGEDGEHHHRRRHHLLGRGHRLAFRMRPELFRGRIGRRTLGGEFAF